MLDGQGADEVLGGYESYFAVIASNLLRERRLLSYARFSRQHKALLGHRPLSLQYAGWSVLGPSEAGREQAGSDPAPAGRRDHVPGMAGAGVARLSPGSARQP